MLNQLEEFINNCKSLRSKKTKKVYEYHLKAYFKAINKSPVDYIAKDIRKLENRERIDAIDIYQNDVLYFAKLIEGRPPKSQITLLSVVKKFLIYNYVEFPQRFWNDLSIRATPIVEKKTPTREELKYILDRGDIKHKALFLLGASSGLRINEVVNLTRDEVDIDNRFIKLKDDKTKGGYSRATFFTEEEKEYLERWLEIRKNFVKKKTYKSKYVREELKKQG